MATRFVNVLGVKWLEEPRGSEKGGFAVITFDLAGTAYTGGADTAQLGGGGTDGRQTTAATLQTIVQNRRRDGKTVTLIAGMNGYAGIQSVATNGPNISAQTVAVAAGNVTLTLFSLPTGGVAVTTTSALWESPMAIVVAYTAT